ncbi:MAG: HD domain-containing protein [Acidobacteriota bacterium]
MDITESFISLVLQALKFAAHKHRQQRRKDKEASPYINHPIYVAELLWRVGQVRDVTILTAAILHDTIEDTDTNPIEIESLFGKEVLSLVQEVSDDKSLPKEIRKQLQVQKAPYKSIGAKHIKLADKICNVHDISHSPPSNWSLQRRKEYLDWTEKVVAGLRGSNQALEDYYDHTLAQAREMLAAETQSQND